MCKQMTAEDFRCPAAYRIIREEKIQEINGTARFFEHLRTGAKVIYLSNHDDNKVFAIGFRTPSDDSTGVAHIMEHSVLCGSDKYPLKEPFVELMKGSLNTFLNAMTYPDKTVYPVASTNSKDFMNLMDVYLDAVFHPAIYHNPEIFMQEGWHYHLENTGDPVTLNGVVYNEMKGVYSDPDNILDHLMMQALYPDTIYRGESGGHPDCIPNLTYDDFLDFHRRYYHPSNSYIYFYGDGDVCEHLDYLDQVYLSAYEAQPADSDIPFQPAFETMRTLGGKYPVSAGESTEDKDDLALGWVISEDQIMTVGGQTLSRYEGMLAMDILGHILLENNSAPLKKALLKLNLCKEIDYDFCTSMQQPYLTIYLKNTSAEHRQIFQDTVTTVLKQLVRDGLNGRDLAAGINTAEFNLKESESGNYPRGLMIGLDLFDTWLYDDRPVENCRASFPTFDHLKANTVIAKIRELSENHGFESLIETCLLNNPHCAMVELTPDAELAERQEKRLSDQLAAFKTDLDEAALAGLQDRTLALLAHQSAPDSPEALATIPKLTLDEIDPQPRQLPMVIEKFGDRTLLWHPAETNGIIYVKLIFDVHRIPQENLCDLSLFTKLLGELETEDYALTDLIQEIEIETGGIETKLGTIDHTVHVGDYRVHLVIKGKVMADRLPKMMTLLESILLRTKFEDAQTIQALIREIRMDKEEEFLTTGHTVGVHRLQSYYTQSGALYDVIGGMDFYHYLVDLDDHFDTLFSALKERLSEIGQQVFHLGDVTLSLTCDPENKAAALTALEMMLTNLSQNAANHHDYQFDLMRRNEGLQTAAKIQYVCKGYNYRLLGYDYTGSLAVLKSLMYTGYLWTNVRVQGGAYGGMIGIKRSGEFYFASYRDPNLTRTLEIYDQAADYIEQLDLSQRELEKVIIGAISSKDLPLSPALQADAADTMYFNGMTPAILQQERDEILHTSVEDLRRLAPLVRDCMAQNAFCVIGGEEVIRSCESVFGEVRSIFEP